MKPLGSNENHLDAHEPRWFAIYTQFKSEKRVQKRLLEQGIQAYLPVQQVTRRFQSTTRRVELPLISCYVFTRITKIQYIQVLNTPGVIRFVRFAQNLVSIPDREIQLLQQIAGAGRPLEAEPISWQTGDEVEIISGSLAGVRGILALHDQKKKVVIELANIGFALRLVVEPALLRYAGKRTHQQQRGGLSP